MSVSLARFEGSETKQRGVNRSHFELSSVVVLGKKNSLDLKPILGRDEQVDQPPEWRKSMFHGGGPFPRDGEMSKPRFCDVVVCPCGICL